MKSLFYSIIASMCYMHSVLAYVPDELKLGESKNSNIIDSQGVTLVGILTLIQSILLKWILPVVVIWASLYIAYELFTADGDETKMKRAWKSIAYTAVGLISIAISYALVDIISRLSI